MRKIMLIVCVILAAFYLSACGGPTQVLRQDIPVSTNPMGADILVDGSAAGVTPGTISLERNRDHIVTLSKKNYRQADVTVKRTYKETSLVDAINSGVNSGLFFKNPTMGVSSGLGAMSDKEKTGEMFELTPTVIKVELMPMSGAPVGGSGSVQPTGTYGQQSDASGPPQLDNGTLVKGLLKEAATIEASKLKPMEKKSTLSSSSNTYTKSDGTVVTTKKSTSGSVSFNPSGVVGLIDKLFKQRLSINGPFSQYRCRALNFNP